MFCLRPLFISTAPLRSLAIKRTVTTIHSPLTSRHALRFQQHRLMSADPPVKRQKMSTSTANGGTAPVIGTHNGHFHADEALAVYLLRLLPEYATSTLIRTRDPETLATCSIVVDVGGVHDHATFRYDHHQREFGTTFPGKATKLSSAGLVWMHYGKRIISAVTGLEAGTAEVELLYQKLYEDFVEAFDANDNGIAVYDPAALRAAKIVKGLNDKGFSIASVVGRYNHGTPGTLNAPSSAEIEDKRFLHASAFVGEQFHLELTDRFNSWLPARAVVAQAFNSRSAVDAKGRILVVPWKQEGVPWMDHLYALEKEAGVEGNVLYALFAENGEKDSKWRIRTVSLEPGSFENRKGLPEAWRGVRDEELSTLSGIPGCIFVHAGGFIGGNLTFEGALEMAKKAVEA